MGTIKLSEYYLTHLQLWLLLSPGVPGCPAGALEFGEIPDTTEKNVYPWFPEKNLNPAIIKQVKFYKR